MSSLTLIAVYSIYLGQATESEADLELSVTVVSPNTQQNFVVEGSLREGVLNNIDIEVLCAQ